MTRLGLKIITRRHIYLKKMSLLNGSQTGLSGLRTRQICSCRVMQHCLRVNRLCLCFQFRRDETVDNFVGEKWHDGFAETTRQSGRGI